MGGPKGEVFLIWGENWPCQQNETLQNVGTREGEATQLKKKKVSLRKHSCSQRIKVAVSKTGQDGPEGVIRVPESWLGKGK